MRREIRARAATEKEKGKEIKFGNNFLIIDCVKWRQNWKDKKLAETKN